jgi:hypothetical protein
VVKRPRHCYKGARASGRHKHRMVNFIDPRIGSEHTQVRYRACRHRVVWSGFVADSIVSSLRWTARIQPWRRSANVASGQRTGADAGAAPRRWIMAARRPRREPRITGLPGTQYRRYGNWARRDRGVQLGLVISTCGSAQAGRATVSEVERYRERVLQCCDCAIRRYHVGGGGWPFGASAIRGAKQQNRVRWTAWSTGWPSSMRPSTRQMPATPQFAEYAAVRTRAVIEIDLLRTWRSAYPADRKASASQKSGRECRLRRAPD